MNEQNLAKVIHSRELGYFCEFETKHIKIWSKSVRSK